MGYTAPVVSYWLKLSTAQLFCYYITVLKPRTEDHLCVRTTTLSSPSLPTPVVINEALVRTFIFCILTKYCCYKSIVSYFFNISSILKLGSVRVTSIAHSRSRFQLNEPLLYALVQAIIFNYLNSSCTYNVALFDRRIIIHCAQKLLHPSSIATRHDNTWSLDSLMWTILWPSGLPL